MNKVESLRFYDKAYLIFRGKAKKNKVVEALFISSMKLLRKGLTRRLLSEIDEVIPMFVPKERIMDTKYMRALRKQLIIHGFVYSVTPSEYFILGFDQLDDSAKIKFVGDYERSWLCSRFDQHEERKLLSNKLECYKHFKKYFHRETLPVKRQEEKELLFDFIVKHNGAIVKEAVSSMGKGVMVFKNEPDRFEEYWEKVSEALAHGATFIAEELIQQSREMAVFHPRSVNTVRVMTFKKNNEVVFLGAFVRFGRGQSVVDNAGSGGIFGELDIKTGMIVGKGITESGEKYEFHPDSGIRITGFQIPRWNELLTFCTSLANELNKKKYVGWDCALTDEGWVMVEGNASGQFVNQYPNRVGMRDRVREYFYPVLGLKKDY